MSRRATPLRARNRHLQTPRFVQGSYGCAAFEFLRRRVTWLCNAVARKRFKDCHRKDFHIEPEGTVTNVPDVVANLFFPRQRVPTVNLRPTCDAGPRFVT